MPDQKSFIENRCPGFYTDKYGTYLHVTAKFMSHNNLFAHALSNYIDHYVIVYFTDHYLIIEGAVIPNLIVTINGSLSMALTATLQSNANLSQVLYNYEM